MFVTYILQNEYSNHDLSYKKHINKSSLYHLRDGCVEVDKYESDLTFELYIKLLIWAGSTHLGLAYTSFEILRVKQD